MKTLAILVLVLCGCRSAGPLVRLEHCRDCTVTVDAQADAQQGKSVPIRADLKGVPIP